MDDTKFGVEVLSVWSIYFTNLLSYASASSSEPMMK